MVVPEEAVQDEELLMLMLMLCRCQCCVDEDDLQESVWAMEYQEGLQTWWGLSVLLMQKEEGVSKIFVVEDALGTGGAG